MRANHANHRAPGRLPGRLTLAAGGAVLANVWSLGLGPAVAWAATGEPAAGLVSQSGATGLLDQLTGTAAPALDHPAGQVESVLQQQIRSGGLPLPGQATSVPDAFAIATVLLPGVPAQPRSKDAESAARASRSGAGHTGVRPAAVTAVVPEQRSPETAADSTGTTADREVAATAPEAVDLATAAGTPEDGIGLAAASQARPEDPDTAVAVLVPIAAGLLLTGAAMYKHRGLPSGH